MSSTRTNNYSVIGSVPFVLLFISVNTHTHALTLHAIYIFNVIEVIKFFKGVYWCIIVKFFGNIDISFN